MGWLHLNAYSTPSALPITTIPHRVEVWGTGGEAAEREQIQRQDARDAHRRRTARSFLLREKNDMGASKLAESDSWIVGLLNVGRGLEYM